MSTMDQLLLLGPGSKKRQLLRSKSWACDEPPLTCARTMSAGTKWVPDQRLGPRGAGICSQSCAARKPGRSPPPTGRVSGSHGLAQLVP